jgi:hypothetical protein
MISGEKKRAEKAEAELKAYKGLDWSRIEDALSEQLTECDDVGQRAALDGVRAVMQVREILDKGLIHTSLKNAPR